MIAAPDPLEAAQQIWSAVHGAVALELKGLVLTPTRSTPTRRFIATLIRGLAPALGRSRFRQWYERESGRRVTWLAEAGQQGEPVGMMNLAVFERGAVAVRVQLETQDLVLAPAAGA